MDKKFLMLGLFLTNSVFGMNIDDCNLNYNAQQQTTLAEDIQEGDFCSGLTSYNGELGYYLLRLDDEEELKHVRKLSLEELIYFNGWTQTLPKTEDEFHSFIQDVENVDPLDMCSRYMAELIFHCVNNEKDILKAKIEDGKRFVSWPICSFYAKTFLFSIGDEYSSLVYEIEENLYDMSSTAFQELVEGLNSIERVIYSDANHTKYIAEPPYYNNDVYINN